MIKAFFFDNGGVMTTGGGGNELFERLAKNLDISLERAFELLTPLQDAYLKGEISEPELWLSIERHYGQPIIKEQRDIWNGWTDMKPLPEMVKLVQRLKDDGYIVGMLSNVIPNTESEVRRNGGYEGFDFLVLSCGVGFSKPAPEIYAIALKHLKDIKPSEVVLLDDKEPNLVPARELGMKTILVKSSSQAINDIGELLNSV